MILRLPVYFLERLLSPPGMESHVLSHRCRLCVVYSRTILAGDVRWYKAIWPLASVDACSLMTAWWVLALGGVDAHHNYQQFTPVLTGDHSTTKPGKWPHLQTVEMPSRVTKLDTLQTLAAPSNSALFMPHPLFMTKLCHESVFFIQNGCKWWNIPILYSS